MVVVVADEVVVGMAVVEGAAVVDGGEVVDVEVGGAAEVVLAAGEQAARAAASTAIRARVTDSG
jgi:hypothetical protein